MSPTFIAREASIFITGLELFPISLGSTIIPWSLASLSPAILTSILSSLTSAIFTLICSKSSVYLFVSVFARTLPSPIILKSTVVLLSALLESVPNLTSKVL